MNALFELFKFEIIWPEVYENAVWCDDGEMVTYNRAGDLNDLQNEEGCTYSGEIRGEAVEKEGYVIYNLDSGCGYDYQVIFKLENKVEA